MKKRNLTAAEKKSILAIITVGCSRETAARYVNCSVWKIREQMKSDSNFAAQMAKAAQESELYFIQKIRSAAEKEQYWRAAAWALERRYPNRYAVKNGKKIPQEQVVNILNKLAAVVVNEVSGKEEQQRLLKRIKMLVKTE
jgi:hypothetical protein